MRILISTVTTIFNYKIKMKTDKIFIETFNKIHEIFNNKNHIILSYFLNKITINQNSIFSSANMIITKKTIFVLNMIFQIIQLKIVNFLLISIEYL